MCKTNYTISTVNSRYLWSLRSMKSLQTLNWGMLKTTAPTGNAGSGLWNSGHKTVITDQHTTLFSTFLFSPWSTSQPLCTQGHRTAPQHNAQAIQIENSISKKKKKKAQKHEKCGTKQTMKRVPVYRMRAEPRDAGRASDDSSGSQGSGTQEFSPLYMCACPWMTAEELSVLILESQIIFFFNNFTY